MPTRIKCKVAYDGTHFAVYQVQPGKRTVQAELEAALCKLHKGAAIRIAASGRTDAGVHAKGQVFHFDTPLSIPADRWPVALNSLLPADIAVDSAEVAEADFHSRFDAKGKEYRYFILPESQRNPFWRNYACLHPQALDVKRMEQAAQYVIGLHDFTSFCSAKTEVEDKVRNLTELEFIEEEGMLVIRFAGNGFLYNMVRILAGTLLEVGRGERDPQEMKAILEAKDRRLAGKTAPAQGLYLWRVDYEDSFMTTKPGVDK